MNRIATLLLLVGSLSGKPVQSEGVRLAQLLAQPERYDEKPVRVRGNYRYGFEWEELYCVPWDKSKRIWLHLPVGESEGLQRQLRKLPKGSGTVNAVFTGVWRAKGPYGHQGFPLQLEVVAVEDVKIVSKSSAFPEGLRKKERARLVGCGGA